MNYFALILISTICSIYEFLHRDFPAAASVTLLRKPPNAREL